MLALRDLADSAADRQRARARARTWCWAQGPRHLPMWPALPRRCPHTGSRCASLPRASATRRRHGCQITGARTAANADLTPGGDRAPSLPVASSPADSVLLLRSSAFAIPTVSVLLCSLSAPNCPMQCQLSLHCVSDENLAPFPSCPCPGGIRRSSRVPGSRSRRV